MQSQDANTRSAGAVNHPGAEEWMAYLYHEIAPERARELRDHVARCAACGEQLNCYRAGMASLDEWKLPALRRPAVRWRPAILLKWAAAAVVVLGFGIAIGRQSSRAASGVAELKESLARLEERIERERGPFAGNALPADDQAANEAAIQLLADYAKLDEKRREEDRLAFAQALREMESRIVRLRAELETVALNTESGFRNTKADLAQLASFAVPDRQSNSELTNPQNKNQ